MPLTRKQKRAQTAKLKKSSKSQVSQEQIQSVLAEAMQMHREGQLDKAMELYKKLAGIIPNNAEVKHLIGVIYYQKGDYKKSKTVIKQAIDIDPDNPAFFNNLGNSLVALEEYNDAIYCYEEAIELKEGNYPEAINNVGATLHQIGEWEKEIKYYKQGLKFNPDNYPLMNELLKTMRDACYWDGFEEYKDLLINASTHAANNNQKVPLTPYHSLTLDIEPKLKKEIAQNYAAMRYQNTPQKWKHKRKPNSPIRIGYVSADYRDHPTAHLINGLFKLHDREKFEVYAYSYGKNDKSQFRKNIEQNVDKFVDVMGMATDAIAKKIYNDKIDILIDVMGYIQNAMPAIFAMRPAPVQISYLAYPGTMGSPFIDYLVTDNIAVPNDDSEYYSEKLIKMPDTYFITDNTQEIAPAPTRKECGLPEDKFVFCSFNKTLKIDPLTFSCWMDILKEVENSVLWLYCDNEFACNNLKKEAQKAGVEPERIIFAKRLPKAEHLARHACADLFLDCFTVNAHTTAIDSLYAGLPIITKEGNDIISRASASILNACGLSELVTTNEIEFKNTAYIYANDKKLLKDLKQKLSKIANTSPLFDNKRYVKNFEEKLLKIVAK
jgi:protein O-GlcNAc transferase